MIRVLKPGMLTSVQDLGRYGHQHLGISVCGAMDRDALRLANEILGNAPGDAALEVTLIGPQLEFLDDAVLCITGADLSASLSGQPVSVARSTVVKRGSILSFGGRVNGCRAYVAFAGGINVPLVLGSRSTDLRVGFGGWQGRALQAGDTIPVQSSAPTSNEARRLQPATPSSDIIVRAIRGPHFEMVAAHSRDALFDGSTFRISAQSNRMGYRMEGPIVEQMSETEILPEPVQFGTVQLPPDGNPIILMTDCQTTGGYPRILEVAAVDLPLLAQAIPGSQVRFSEISLDDAQNLYRHQL